MPFKIHLIRKTTNGLTNSFTKNGHTKSVSRKNMVLHNQLVEKFGLTKLVSWVEKYDLTS